MTTANTGPTECPLCGQRGRTVQALTLRALLKEELVGKTTEHNFRFCDAAGCDVVYFGGSQWFTRSQLKVPVGVKELAGERPLCYCFGHSVASIKQEIAAKGRSDALEDIRGKMEDPGCRCEVTNPSGSCCLGSVARGIRTATEELGMSDSGNTQLDPAANAAAQSRGAKFAKVGAVISAMVASSCCWLPLVLLAAGVSGMGIAATMEAYRPLFSVFTCGLLAAAFYFTYAPRRAATAARRDCCGPETDLATFAGGAKTGRRWSSMMNMNKIMLWLATAVAIAFLLFPSYVGRLLGTSERVTTTAELQRTVVKIDGMTCEGCAAIAEKAIRDVAGVLAAEVSFERGEAVIVTEACCPVPRAAVANSLQTAGYESTFVDDSAYATSRLVTESAGRQDLQAANVGEKVDPQGQLIFKVNGFT